MLKLEEEPPLQSAKVQALGPPPEDMGTRTWSSLACGDTYPAGEA